MNNWENKWLDYYEILKVKRDATAEEIKLNYRKLSRENHPDLHPEASEEELKAYEETTKQLNEAYDVLSDKNKKEEYDTVWDARKNGTYNGADINKEENVSYEEVKKYYTAEENRYTKVVSLKEIIDEELKKTEIIINSISEIIYTLSKELDKDAYYESVKEVVSISSEFIHSLEELAIKAYEYDLMTEEEIIRETISFLTESIEKIPLTPDEANSYIEHENYLEITKTKISNELILKDEIVSKIKSVLIYTYERKISHLEYKSIIDSCLLEAKSIISNLTELGKIANTLSLSDESQSIIDAVEELSHLMGVIPDRYDAAISLGKKHKLQEQIEKCRSNIKIYKGKLEEILNIVEKQPNDPSCEVLYNDALSLLYDCRDELKGIKKELGDLDLKKQDNYTKEIEEEALKNFANAQNLSRVAEDTHNALLNLGDNPRNTNEYIYRLLFNSLSANYKGQAIELLINAKQISEYLKAYNVSEKEYQDLCSDITDLINLVDKMIFNFTGDYDKKIKHVIKRRKKAFDSQLEQLNNDIFDKYAFAFLEFLTGLIFSGYAFKILLSTSSDENNIFTLSNILKLFISGVVTITCWKKSLKNLDEVQPIVKEKEKLLSKNSNNIA